jgi:hypothetical protein
VKLRDFTPEETVQVSALVYSPGYKILRDALQASLDTLTDAIEDQTDDVQERRVTAEWRSLRRLLKLMDYLIQQAREETTSLRNLEQQTGQMQIGDTSILGLESQARQATAFQNILKGISYDNLTLGDEED